MCTFREDREQLIFANDALVPLFPYHYCDSYETSPFQLDLEEKNPNYVSCSVRSSVCQQSPSSSCSSSLSSCSWRRHCHFETASRSTSTFQPYVLTARADQSVCCDGLRCFHLDDAHHAADDDDDFHHRENRKGWRYHLDYRKLSSWTIRYEAAVVCHTSLRLTSWQYCCYHRQTSSLTSDHHCQPTTIVPNRTRCRTS